MCGRTSASTYLTSHGTRPGHGGCASLPMTWATTSSTDMLMVCQSSVCVVCGGVGVCGCVGGVYVSVCMCVYMCVCTYVEFGVCICVALHCPSLCPCT